MSTKPVTGCRTAVEHRGGAGLAERLVLELDDFACEALQEQSSRLGVSSEELAAFSVLYYLADVDSGRVSRRLPRPPEEKR